MKQMISTTLLLSVLVGSLVLLGSGCSKKTVVPPESTAGSGVSSGKTINYPPAEGGYSENNLPTEGSLDDTSLYAGGGDMSEPSDEYKKMHGRSSQGLSPIYFDFDQAGIRSDMAEVMVLNAEYLQQIPSALLIIEGNSDDRGTNEYNLALGERRAQNAKQYLLDLGIDPARVRTVSYGEEKPLFTGQDEFSYSQNRRDDFIIE